MTTATLEPESPPAPAAFATLWVPELPCPAGRGAVASDQHFRWLRRCAAHRDLARHRGRWDTIAVPFRVEAVVFVADGRRHAIDDAATDRWREGVRQAVERTLTRDRSLLRGVEVRYRPLDGVPLEDQPMRTGVDFRFYEESR